MTDDDTEAPPPLNGYIEWEASECRIRQEYDWSIEYLMMFIQNVPLSFCQPQLQLGEDSHPVRRLPDDTTDKWASPRTLRRALFGPIYVRARSKNLMSFENVTD